MAVGAVSVERWYLIIAHCNKNHFFSAPHTWEYRFLRNGDKLNNKMVITR